MTTAAVEARGILLAPSGQQPMALRTRYRVEVAAIEEAVERALTLTPERRAAMGTAAHNVFLDNGRSVPTTPYRST